MTTTHDRLKQWLTAAAPASTLPRPDARLALGVLLVRVAKADKAYLFEELEQIDRVIGELSGLDPIQSAKTRAMCEKLEEAVPDTASFAGLIREGVTYDDRLDMVRALWSVVLADGIEQPQEVALVEWIETELGIIPDDCIAAHTVARAAQGV